MALQNPITPALQNVNIATQQIVNIAKAVTTGIGGQPATASTPEIAAIPAAEFLAAAPEPNRIVFKIIAAAVTQNDARKLEAALAALQ